MKESASSQILWGRVVKNNLTTQFIAFLIKSYANKISLFFLLISKVSMFSSFNLDSYAGRTKVFVLQPRFLKVKSKNCFCTDSIFAELTVPTMFQTTEAYSIFDRTKEQ